jgi:hypothetical protein
VKPHAETGNGKWVDPPATAVGVLDGGRGTEYSTTNKETSALSLV